MSKIAGIFPKYFSQKKKFGKIRPILDTKKWLWKYEFCNLWQGCSSFWQVCRCPYFVKKCLFSIDALVVCCPTWSKNLGRTLLYICLWITFIFFLPWKSSWLDFSMNETTKVTLIIFLCLKLSKAFTPLEIDNHPCTTDRLKVMYWGYNNQLFNTNLSQIQTVDFIS